MPDRDAGDDRPRDAEARGRRDVEVPVAVYKRVTVVSTLFAVVCVLAGFALVDAATNRARAPLDEVDPILATVGVGVIALGAAVYAFGTRFRAEGMGNAKDETGRP